MSAPHKVPGNHDTLSDLRTSLSGGLRFTADDAALCLKNARRLMRDSRRVSKESRVALLELALEEIAKGHMILYRMMAQNPIRRPSHPVQLGFDTRTLDPVIRGHSHLLSDEAVRAAFWDHDIKLETVEFLLSGIEAVPLEKVDFRKLRDAGLPVGARFLFFIAGLPVLRKAGIDSLKQMLGKIREQGVTRLDDIGKRATYVDLTNKVAPCVPPVGDSELARTLGEIDTMLSRALGLGLKMLTHLS